MFVWGIDNIMGRDEKRLSKIKGGTCKRSQKDECEDWGSVIRA